MTNLRQIVDGKVLRAYGTSTGVQKAWDTRGRGRKQQEQELKVRRMPESSLLRILPADEMQPFQKAFVGDKPMVGMPPKQMREEWKSKYNEFGDKFRGWQKKIEDPEEAKTTAGKFFHFLRAIGEWHDAWGNIRDLIIEAAAGVWVASKLAPHLTAAVGNTLLWAHMHIAPVMHHLATLLGSEDKSADRIVKQTFPGNVSTMAAMADRKVLLEI